MHFYPPIQPSLLTMLLYILRLWTATFICSEWIVQYLHHLTVSYVKTKLHASSLLCCRVSTPSLLLPPNTIDLTRVHCNSCLVCISHTFSCKVCVWGEQRISIFPHKVGWWGSSDALLDHFGITFIGFNQISRGLRYSFSTEVRILILSSQHVMQNKMFSFKAPFPSYTTYLRMLPTVVLIYDN